MFKFNKVTVLPAILMFTAFAIVACEAPSSATKDDTTKSTADSPGEVNFTSLAVQGKIAFDKNCASCHGDNVMGTEMGPPLIHDIYNPGHHNDMSFYRAIKQGTVQHHWQFGDMLPRPEVKDEEIGGIIQYVRELQEAHGIVYKQHRM
ncbi:MAG: cytochrome c [Robiginitomaculum sp.]|nr:cytochrome c [Robiginitomaculum sp.]